ncbi:MAG: tRNA lysidine(34) synthetase TilS [Treponema sp.]|jgi:tRNA(Ile)-lysidine synthase|nr:tRNA lysidine(34) synthetase TilS [Treponema sp.]
MHPFEAAALAALDSAGASSARYVAALSGGADSSALTAALAALRAAGKIGALSAVHVNHGIRSAAECAADEESARVLCAARGIPLTVTTIPAGRVAEYARVHHTGMEAAARRFRHEAFRAEKKRLGGTWVLALAHTRDDVLENVLMAVLRGAGPAGLGAMRPRGRGLVRPLAALGRAEVLAYLADSGITCGCDASNADTRYLRNRVRAKLVPLLDTEFPHWRKPLLRLWETQGLAADALAVETEYIPEAGAGTKAVVIAESDLAAMPLIRAEETLFRACNRLGGGRVPRDLCRRFLRGEKAVDLGKGFRLERKRGTIIVSAPCSGTETPEREAFTSSHTALTGSRASVGALHKEEAEGDPKFFSADNGICRVPRRAASSHTALAGSRASAGVERPTLIEGFSVLIKKPGIYKLKTCTIEARQEAGGEWVFAVYR